LAAATAWIGDSTRFIFGRPRPFRLRLAAGLDWRQHTLHLRSPSPLPLALGRRRLLIRPLAATRLQHNRIDETRARPLGLSQYRRHEDLVALT
jgi:hypothetical protein